MKKLLIITSVFIAQIATAQNLPFYQPPAFINSANSVFDNHPYANIISQAELTATPNAQKILITARQMVENGEIIKGGCWDYLNTAWNRAGFGDKQRTIIFRGDIKTPPYANINDILAGDWLYHVNYSYNNIEHSGMFIGWIDKENAIGLTLSYAGEKRGEPARYKAYDLSGVYRITRAS
ncbi:hypothetical protein [Moraxella oblonga]|uniref:hypothetical protein n=1 Tax=Moraxella oblonga TaxID=200413 RepID=UPI000832BC6E|nr:hypothetical protein [Moraxella oblonga]